MAQDNHPATMSFIVGREDADYVQKIFDSTPEPKFTMVSRLDIADGECAIIELYAESSMHIWYLIGRVAMEQHYDQKTREAIDKCKQELDRQHQELDEELKKLNQKKQ